MLPAGWGNSNACVWLRPGGLLATGLAAATSRRLLLLKWVVAGLSDGFSAVM